MTRTEAKNNLEMISIAFIDTVTKEQRKLIDDTFEMAIKALEQEPLTESDDCVNRGQLDKCLYELRMDNIYDMPSFWCHDNKDYRVIPTKYYKGYEQAIMDIEEKIAKLPSVQPKRDKGEWIEKDKEMHKYFCSKCGCGEDLKTNFCSNCGAKMQEAEE